MGREWMGSKGGDGQGREEYKGRKGKGREGENGEKDEKSKN